MKIRTGTVCSYWLAAMMVLAHAAVDPVDAQTPRRQQRRPARQTVTPKRTPARLRLPEEKVANPNGDIDQYIRAEMQRQRLVGLGLGVVHNGAVIYLKGHGWQDREARIPVNSWQTMFRWASISQTLTAISAVKLERAK